jgi:hypothetical protein
MIELISNFLSEHFAKHQMVKTDKSESTNQIINGAYIVKNTTVPQGLTINGKASLSDDVIFKEKIIINGSLKARDVTFESDLTSNGTTFISDSKIKGYAFLRGAIQSKNSVFMKIIKILGDDANFENCQMDGLIVQKLPNNKIVYKIRLTNSTVAGDIVFESGMGKVFVDASSTIQGKIIGGELIKEND